MKKPTIEEIKKMGLVHNLDYACDQIEAIPDDIPAANVLSYAEIIAEDHIEDDKSKMLEAEYVEQYENAVNNILQFCGIKKNKANIFYYEKG